MDNKLKFKTRLVAIQIVAQQLINRKDIDIIKNDFDRNYRNTKLDESLDKTEYNVNFLSKLIENYKTINFKKLSIEINSLINFTRKFEKWDTINQAIILVSISELRNLAESKIIIVLNDYLEISKSFVTLRETKLLNLILDKLINAKK